MRDSYVNPVENNSYNSNVKETAHKHSRNHREEIERSEICGCFYCIQIFTPDNINKWTNEKENKQVTALCPYCGIDSVIGSASGFSIDQNFLCDMRDYWNDY